MSRMCFNHGFDQVRSIIAYVNTREKLQISRSHFSKQNALLQHIYVVL